METNEKEISDKKQLCAVCGLFCPACTLFIGTKEEPQRLQNMADRHNTRADAWECNGCRSEKRSYWCEHICQIKPCADKRGIEFCGECDEYPCDMLKDFQKERPHRIELWKTQDRIAEAGYLKWFEEMVKHYSCTNCHTINSAYDITCRNCGTKPSCQYVKLHKKDIEASILNQNNILKK
jgi:hypothetical protein